MIKIGNTDDESESESSDDVDIDPPDVDIDLPVVDIDPLVVDIDPLVVDIDPLVVDIDLPDVDIDSPDVDIDSPVVDIDPPVVDIVAGITEVNNDTDSSDGADRSGVFFADEIMPCDRGSVSDSDDSDEEVVFKCSCKLNDGQPCHTRYELDELAMIRLQYLLMTHDILG